MIKKQRKWCEHDATLLSCTHCQGCKISMEIVKMIMASCEHQRSGGAQDHPSPVKQAFSPLPKCLPTATLVGACTQLPLNPNVAQPITQHYRHCQWGSQCTSCLLGQLSKGKPKGVAINSWLVSNNKVVLNNGTAMRESRA